LSSEVDSICESLEKLFDDLVIEEKSNDIPNSLKIEEYSVI
jgi:hypothetical protein